MYGVCLRQGALFLRFVFDWSHSRSRGGGGMGDEGSSGLAVPDEQVRGGRQVSKSGEAEQAISVMAAARAEHQRL